MDDAKVRGTQREMKPGEAVACELRVGGMDCASCAASVEDSLGRLEGVEKVEVDVLGGRVRIGYAEGKVTRRDMIDAIRRVGYRVQDERLDAGGQAALGVAGDQVATPKPFWERRGRLVTTTTSGVALGLAAIVAALEGPSVLATALLVLSTIAGGWYVVPRGLRAARNRALDMNFLMTVAAAGAWVIGESTEAAATLFLFSVAALLEAYSMDRARNAIRALMELSPAEANVVRDGQERRVLASDVRIGETVIVRPGEKLPVDGAVVGGRSSVNQAPITGESMPVDKALGAEVFAGSLNGHGALEIRSTKEACDTTLARIVHAVEEAQATRAPSQSFVDRFALVYTPVVVAIALLLAVIPPLAGAGTWETWVYRALAMLVVACPCALVISTPVTIVSGLTGAARAGILIKGGAHLENAGRVTTIAFDKTGTLTIGEPAVTDVIAFDGRSRDDVLRLALGVERHSEHPLGQAILAHGRMRGLTPPPSASFEALVGRGAGAMVADERVLIGNARLAGEVGVASVATADALRRFEGEGKSAVFVSVSGRSVGVIAIADQVRPEAAHALASLRAAGIRHTIMLTGDNAGTARAIANALGVTDYRAELLPEDKLRIIRELEASGKRVAFVGDGVNDAPALAAATIGVAMGAAGTDVAIETADIALMSDDLSKLALAIQFSRKTVRVIKQNVWFSIMIKAVFLGLALGGWATLWMAVVADMGSSLAVVANGLRARRA